MSKVNKNIAYLGLSQIIKFIIPLMTFPYLTRVLGVEGFGLFVLLTAIIGYGTMIVQFGFDLSATAEVARIKDDKNKLSEFAYRIIFVKILLCIITLIIIHTVIKINVSSDSVYNQIIYFYPAIIGAVFFPSWLFQGLEKMKVMAMILLIGRASTIPFVFVYVNSSQDLYLAGLFQSIAVVISAIISIFFIKKEKLLNAPNFKNKEIYKTLSDGWALFLSSVSYSMYSTATPLIIGFLSGPAAVAYFNIAQTIKNVALNLMAPIYQSIFPRVNALMESNINLAKDFIAKYLVISLILGFFGVSVLIIFPELIITIVSGDEYIAASPILIILAISILFSIMNNFFGLQTLIPFGYQNVFSKIVIIAGVLGLALTFILTGFYDSFGAAIAILLTEILVLILLLKTHIKLELDVFRHILSAIKDNKFFIKNTKKH
jgi:PST family polysaccharide transporter